MTVDLRHNVVAGFEQGFPDILARPDLTTLVALPWQPDVVACIVRPRGPGNGEPVRRWTRAARSSASCVSYAELGVSPMVGPELEFYLCEPDPTAPNGYRPYAAQDSPRVHRRGRRRPQGNALPRCSTPRSSSASARSPPPTSTGAASTRSTSATARRSTPPTGRSASRRWSRSWPRATGCWRPSWASRSTTTRDRAFTCTSRSRMRDGAQHLRGRRRRPHGLDAARRATSSPACSSTAPAMMVFFNPTVNAYRRISAEALVPTRVCWGHDHRMTLVRVPQGARRGDPAGDPPRRRHGQPLPGLHRRARRRPRRDPARARAARAARGDDLRPARGGAGRGAADHLPGGAGRARATTR